MELFGEAAARLCGAAALLLGWRPAEFWEATPAELALALEPRNVTGAGLSGATLDALRQRFPDN
jgi:uncharacterized phage protein (TIGR02216 family)